MLKIEVNVAEEFTAEVRGQELKINVSRLPDVARRAIWDYGLQRMLNDASGKAGKLADYASEAEWKAAALEAAKGKLDALYRGETRMNGIATAKDPVREQSVIIARAILAKTEGGLPKDPKDQAKAIGELLAGARGAAIKTKAEQVVAMIKAAAEVGDEDL